MWEYAHESKKNTADKRAKFRQESNHESTNVLARLTILNPDQQVALKLSFLQEKLLTDTNKMNVPGNWLIHRYLPWIMAMVRMI